VCEWSEHRRVCVGIQLALDDKHAGVAFTPAAPPAARGADSRGAVGCGGGKSVGKIPTLGLGDLEMERRGHELRIASRPLRELRGA
jgi:hypothetical protein